MSIKTRLNQLENQQIGDEKEIVLKQDSEDPDLFTDQDGREYRKGGPDFPESVFMVIYSGGWQPACGVKAAIALPDNGRKD